MNLCTGYGGVGKTYGMVAAGRSGAEEEVGSRTQDAAGEDFEALAGFDEGWGSPVRGAEDFESLRGFAVPSMGAALSVEELGRSAWTAAAQGDSPHSDSRAKDWS